MCKIDGSPIEEERIEAHVDVSVLFRLTSEQSKPLLSAIIDGKHIVSFQVDTGGATGDERLTLAVQKLCCFEMVRSALVSALVDKLSSHDP